MNSIGNFQQLIVKEWAFTDIGFRFIFFLIFDSKGGSCGFHLDWSIYPTFKNDFAKKNTVYKQFVYSVVILSSSDKVIEAEISIEKLVYYRSTHHHFHEAIENIYLFIYLHGDFKASAWLLHLLLGWKKNTKMNDICIHSNICKSLTQWNTNIHNDEQYLILGHYALICHETILERQIIIWQIFMNNGTYIKTLEITQ